MAGSVELGDWLALAATELNCAAVVPLDDLRDHDPDSAGCWCRPTYDDGVLVHHAMDGRERHEEGADRQ